MCAITWVISTSGSCAIVIGACFAHATLDSIATTSQTHVFMRRILAYYAQ